MSSIPFPIFFALLAVATPLLAGPITGPYDLPRGRFSEPAPRLIVENRILARIHGKAISALDLTKKMDLLFVQQFPEQTTSAEARFQFYQVNWRQLLEDLIDKELILADAKEMKLPITVGDVRQEMESLFGPDVVMTLSKVNLSYEEARQVIEGDILLRRMFYLRVQSPASRQLTPQKIIDAYPEYAEAHRQPARWSYRVLSVRDRDARRATETAEQLRALLLEQNGSFSAIEEHLETLSTEGENPTRKVTLSSPLSISEKELSQLHRDGLHGLNDGELSPIRLQTGRGKEVVARLFYLERFSPESMPSFSEAELPLKEELLQKISSQEANRYLTSLEERFHVDRAPQLSDAEFSPFHLR